MQPTMRQLESSVFQARGPRGFAVPEIALAMCRRIEAELVALSPDLDTHDCTRILQELAIADTVVLRIAQRVRNTRDYELRASLPRSLPVASAAVTSLRGQVVEVVERSRGASREDGLWKALGPGEDSGL